MGVDLSRDVALWDIVARLSLAACLGAVLGWERERLRKPAGLRTHMLVALGTAAFTISCLHLYAQVLQTLGDGTRVQADPIRILEAVVGGLGFLGAGTIIQSRGSVRGITTAATVWVTGAIGLACGMGHYPLAVAAMVPAFLIVAVLGRVEHHVVPQSDRADEDGEVEDPKGPERSTGRDRD